MSKKRAETFDIFNVREYEGPNPYLNTRAVVFDFTFFLEAKPLTVEDYVYKMGNYLPQLRGLKVKTYAEMLAQTMSEVSQLEMGLYVERFSIKSETDKLTIALQSIHHETTRGVIDLVWDCLEAITFAEDFDFERELTYLQGLFRDSTYGGPTIYSILQTAYHRRIPTFYLPDERLIQYGYGKYQIRGVATTFNCDSQLDSDFTTQKDDCKAFLATCGFPVPQGEIVYTLDEAFEAIKKIGYPVAVKPVVGHKGIGVTANVRDDRGLEFAFSKAKEATEPGKSSIIIEQSITGSDFRLLCVGGKFAAAVERRPPFVTGDGESTIEKLIDKENATEARQDTPTSALGKIITDEVMDKYLEEQGLSVDTILKSGEVIYLRKVANLSSGGVSIDSTSKIHPDNMILAQDIAQYFRLVCMGVDIIAEDISRSWKEGNFGIIEINSAPGIFMHLNPAVGDSVDVPGNILDYLFPSSQPCRVPIITFNKLYREEIYEIVDHILLRHPDWLIGSVCQDAMFLNRSEKVLNKEYSSNIKSLLRHPKLNLLIAEYPQRVFASEGMVYEGSDLIVLDEPTETEMILARDLLPNKTLIIKQSNSISVKVQGMMESYTLAESESFSYVYLKEITRLLSELTR